MIMIDKLIYDYVFPADKSQRDSLVKTIRSMTVAFGVIPSSIQNLYMAAAKNVYTQKTVPAINLRGTTYEAARSVFRAALKNQVGAFIFEIARSEMSYTNQEPEEYALCILAAAIKEGYKGPVFI